MTTIAVTGATGHFGRLALNALIARGVRVGDLTAIGRSPDKLAELSALGVKTRVADYTDPDSLRTAFDGIDRLLFVSSSEVGQRVPQHLNVVAAAKDAGVGRIAYTSIANVENSGMSLAAEHLATEKAIAESGVPHTFLRNGWYTENYTDQLATQRQHGAVLGSAGHGQVSAASRADYAEAAAAVVLDEAPAQAYEFGGAPFTLAEYAEAVTRVIGTPVRYQDLPPQEYGAALASAGVPAPYVEMLVDSDQGLARGDLLVTSDDLATVLGRPTTSLEDAIGAAFRS